MRLTPAEQNNHFSPAAARWARAYDALERAIKRDPQDEPWVVRLADQLHHTGRGLVTGIAASVAEPVSAADVQHMDHSQNVPSTGDGIPCTARTPRAGGDGPPDHLGVVTTRPGPWPTPAHAGVGDRKSVV